LLVRLDGEPALVLVIAPEPHRARGLRDDRRLLGPARLEQLRHPRQTAGDVAGLGALGRNARDDVARLHLAARIDRDDGVDGELITRVPAARQLEDLAVLALDDDRRTQVGAAPRAPVGDHALGDAGRFVERLRYGLAFHQVLEADRALDLGHHRPGVGIPLGDALTALDPVALVDVQARAVLHAVHRALGAVLVDHHDRHVATHGDQLAVRVAHDVLVLDADRAVEVRLDQRLLGDLRRAADVERAHGELRARLADRLGRDHADRLAHVDRGSARKIAPVAFGANAAGHLAGEPRTDAHLLDAGVVDRLALRLLDQRAALDQHGVARRIADVLGGGAAEDAPGERSHHLARVDDRAHLDARLGLAVVVGDDAVLRHVDEPPRQIAGVGGLERGVGEA